MVLNIENKKSEDEKWRTLYVSQDSAIAIV